MARFYGLTPDALGTMSWRRFQNLAGSLFAYSHSAWARLQADTSTRVDSSRIAPTVAEGLDVFMRTNPKRVTK